MRRKKPKYKQGYFHPAFPDKYKGDVENIYYRSGLELKYMRFFDLNSAILEWHSEETVIPYIDKTTNKKRRYYMDFWIKIKNNDGKIEEYLIEIKPFRQVNPKRFTKHYSKIDYAKNLCKWDAAKRFAEANNMKFIIQTEKNI